MQKVKMFFGTLIVFMVVGMLLQSCKKEPNPNESNELITSLKVVFTDSANASNKLVFSFIDLDADKPNLPTQFDSIVLAPNTTYFSTLILLDESKNPVDTISNEIIQEANDHLFLYRPTPASFVSILITDKDAKGLPLGIDSKWRTASVGRGAIKIILKHQPGIKNGTETPGDTDIEVDFPTIVQ